MPDEAMEPMPVADQQTEQKTTRMEDLIDDVPEPEKVELIGSHEDVVQVDPEMVVQSCGLPLFFCFRGSKMKIVKYVTQYEITHRMRRELEMTKTERELYAKYRHKIGALSAPIDYFVAAIRLWKSDHPIARPAPTDLNAFKVN